MRTAMYKCQKCNKRTEFIDEPPCEDDHEFKPVEITTIHKFIIKDGQKVILCTDKPPRRGAVMIGGNYGISCVRCRAKLKELFSPENEEAVNLPEPQKTDKLLSDLE